MSAYLKQGINNATRFTMPPHVSGSFPESNGLDILVDSSILFHLGLSADQIATLLYEIKLNDWCCSIA